MATFPDNTSSSSSPLSSSSGTSKPYADPAGEDSFQSPASGSMNAGSSSGMGSSIGSGTDAPKMLDRVVQGAHATIDRLAETAAPHVQRLQEGMSSASDTLHNRAGQARETGDEWTETLRCAVRDNPLAAVATALAVGALIARLTADSR